MASETPRTCCEYMQWKGHCVLHMVSIVLPFLRLVFTAVLVPLELAYREWSHCKTLKQPSAHYIV